MLQDTPDKKPLLSVAPMMDWTDRHCRFFHRLLAPHARLYTEMVTAPAILHGDCDRLLGFDASEHPVALQLGGSEPNDLAKAARIGAEYGYDEINLNCGCPSDRVQNGAFGACLMADPQRVADCMAAMIAVLPAGIPATVKCRIGIDDANPEEMLPSFIETVSKAGVATFIIHARKAWLQGLSPKENREVPPLDYELAYRMKTRFPHLTIVINGGIDNIADAKNHLAHCDGVMIGRAAYQTPELLADLSCALHAAPLPDMAGVLHAMAEYCDREAARNGTPVKSVVRHMLGLFGGAPGARAWRRIISENAYKADNGGFILDAYNAAFGKINDRLVS